MGEIGPGLDQINTRIGPDETIAGLWRGDRERMDDHIYSQVLLSNESRNEGLPTPFQLEMVQDGVGSLSSRPEGRYICDLIGEQLEIRLRPILGVIAECLDNEDALGQIVANAISDALAIANEKMYLEGGGLIDYYLPSTLVLHLEFADYHFVARLGDAGALIAPYFFNPNVEVPRLSLKMMYSSSRVQGEFVVRPFAVSRIGLITLPDLVLFATRERIYRPDEMLLMLNLVLNNHSFNELLEAPSQTIKMLENVKYFGYENLADLVSRDDRGTVVSTIPTSVSNLGTVSTLHQRSRLIKNRLEITTFRSQQGEHLLGLGSDGALGIASFDKLYARLRQVLFAYGGEIRNVHSLEKARLILKAIRADMVQFQRKRLGDLQEDNGSLLLKRV